MIARFAGSDALEPRIAEVLAERLVKRERGPYRPLNTPGVTDRLARFLDVQGIGDYTVSALQRMAGGASKEQFSFVLEQAGQSPERMVLRIDPLESIVETCRYREAEVLRACAEIVPVADVRFLDGDGSLLGQPAVVTGFVQGVNKPPVDGTVRVSGLGVAFSDQWRAKLAPQFLANLARIHGLDWRSADLAHFSAPDDFPEQAALWQVNWWAEVWRGDVVNHHPVMSLAERWMRERLPKCDDPVLLHGDYRTGNFLFDPESGAMSAVLDWELTHIGDFHEDLGWTIQRLFAGFADSGEAMICNLMSREDFITGYEGATGRVVNRDTLAFYELLGAYKCGAMNLATGYGIALRQNNHQDALLSLLCCVGHVFVSEMIDIMAAQETSA